MLQLQLHPFECIIESHATYVVSAPKCMSLFANTQANNCNSFQFTDHSRVNYANQQPLVGFHPKFACISNFSLSLMSCNYKLHTTCTSINLIVSPSSWRVALVGHLFRCCCQSLIDVFNRRSVSQSSCSRQRPDQRLELDPQKTNTLDLSGR